MTDDRLTSAVAALERVPVPVRWGDVERRLAGDGPEPAPGADRRPGPGRRRRLAVALAATAAAVVALGAVALWPEPEPEPVETGPGPGPDPTTTTTAPATRSSRTFPVTAVTGQEYLVWAGEAGDNDVSQRADGFAVDLGTGAVRPIPAAPIAPRSAATGVWTGTELIVCCGAGPEDGYPADTRSAAAWDPATGEWRELARPPASVARSFPASVWTGEVVVVVATGPAAATYDPGTDRWTEVAAPPAIDRHPEAAWTGSEVVVWDARSGSGGVPPDGTVADRGWRWAPGRAAWEALPPLPPGSRTRLGSMAWTGTEIVVWGEATGQEGIGVGAAWRPGDAGWQALPPSPQGPVASYEGRAGSQAVVFDPGEGQVLVRALDGGDGVPPPLLIYDPATGAWTTADVTVPGHHPPITVAEGRLLVPDEARPVVGPAPR
jgi:hypothetical protein